MKCFKYDKVFDEYSTQEDVFNDSISPFVDEFIEGYNWAVFWEGQSKTGKTYTLFGNDDSPDNEGVILKTTDKMFSKCWYSLVISGF